MRTIITSMLIFISFCTFGQTFLDNQQMDLIKTKIESYIYNTNKRYVDNETFLVSTYTFRSLVQKDFSKITIGENSSSKVGRYATLSINSDESRFYLTPFTFVDEKDKFEGSFKYIHSIDLSGEINDKNIFDFKNKKSLKAGYSLTKIFSKGGYTPKEGARDVEFHRKMVEMTGKKTMEKFNKAQVAIADYIEISANDGIADTAKLHKTVKKVFFDTLEDYENKYYGNKWAVKRLFWLKMNVIPFSWDNFSYIDSNNLPTYSSPGSKSVYTPNIKISFNQLWTFPSMDNNQFYWSIYLSAGQKHSLSEISKPSQWYNMKRLTDSTLFVSDDKKVYSLNDNDFKTAIRPDAGVQVIYIFNKIKDFSLGVDLVTSFTGIVGDREGAYVNKTSIGLLVPFTDKDGESTINVELFYQRKSFIKSTFANEGLFGIKFGLPFSQL